MLKKFLTLIVALLMLSNSASAAQKILFVPHDDRPVSSQQPAEVVAQLGYEVIMPPPELTTRPDDLWQWLNENAPAADAAVVASDALLYGGLIPSRSHEIPADVLDARVENFKALHENNPDLKLYVFGSLMRTPTARRFFNSPSCSTSRKFCASTKMKKISLKTFARAYRKKFCATTSTAAKKISTRL